MNFFHPSAVAVFQQGFFEVWQKPTVAVSRKKTARRARLMGLILIAGTTADKQAIALKLQLLSIRFTSERFETGPKVSAIAIFNNYRPSMVT
jgi:hypothetical protein